MEVRIPFSHVAGKRKTKIEVQIPFSHVAGKRLALRYTHCAHPSVPKPGATLCLEVLFRHPSANVQALYRPGGEEGKASTKLFHVLSFKGTTQAYFDGTSITVRRKRLPRLSVFSACTSKRSVFHCSSFPLTITGLYLKRLLAGL